MLLLSSDSLLREFTRYKLTAMTNITQLLKEFERIAYGQSLHSAFTDLLDWTLLPFKMHETSKAQQKAFEAYRSHPKAIQLVTLLSLIGDSSEDFADPLGELYQQAISSGHNGQFWTLSTCAI